MSDIQDALSQIYRIEGALVVTSPVAKSIKRVWPYYPPQSQVITDTPCFLNAYSPTRVDFDSALMRVNYSVHAQLLIADADTDQAAKIAASFQQPIITAFAANIKLGLSDWTVLTLRFNGEQPKLFSESSDVSGWALIGLDFFIDLQHNFAASYAVGAAP